MKLKALIAGVVGSFAIASSAFAADVIVIPPPAPPPPMVVAPAGYNWGGLYIGAAYVTVVGPAAMGGMGGGVFGAQVGFNVDRGSGLVFGAEGYVLTDFADYIFGVDGRVGFALGATRRFLAYGTVGALFIPGGGTVATFGGGAAFAIGERLSVFADVKALTAGGAVACCLLRIGANFHFGN